MFKFDIDFQKLKNELFKISNMQNYSKKYNDFIKNIYKLIEDLKKIPQQKDLNNQFFRDYSEEISNKLYSTSKKIKENLDKDDELLRELESYEKKSIIKSFLRDISLSFNLKTSKFVIELNGNKIIRIYNNTLESIIPSLTKTENKEKNFSANLGPINDLGVESIDLIDELIKSSEYGVVYINKENTIKIHDLVTSINSLEKEKNLELINEYGIDFTKFVDAKKITKQMIDKDVKTNTFFIKINHLNKLKSILLESGIAEINPLEEINQNKLKNTEFYNPEIWNQFHEKIEKSDVLWGVSKDRFGTNGILTTLKDKTKSSLSSFFRKNEFSKNIIDLIKNKEFVSLINSIFSLGEQRDNFFVFSINDFKKIVNNSMRIIQILEEDDKIKSSLGNEKIILIKRNFEDFITKINKKEYKLNKNEVFLESSSYFNLQSGFIIENPQIDNIIDKVYEYSNKINKTIDSQSGNKKDVNIIDIYKLFGILDNFFNYKDINGKDLEADKKKTIDKIGSDLKWSQLKTEFSKQFINNNIGKVFYYLNSLLTNIMMFQDLCKHSYEISSIISDENGNPIWNPNFQNLKSIPEQNLSLEEMKWFTNLSRSSFFELNNFGVAIGLNNRINVYIPMQKINQQEKNEVLDYLKEIEKNLKISPDRQFKFIKEMVDLSKEIFTDLLKKNNSIIYRKLKHKNIENADSKFEQFKNIINEFLKFWQQIKNLKPQINLKTESDIKFLIKKFNKVIINSWIKIADYEEIQNEKHFDDEQKEKQLQYLQDDSKNNLDPDELRLLDIFDESDENIYDENEITFEDLENDKKNKNEITFKDLKNDKKEIKKIDLTWIPEEILNNLKNFYNIFKSIFDDVFSQKKVSSEKLGIVFPDNKKYKTLLSSFYKISETIYNFGKIQINEENINSNFDKFYQNIVMKLLPEVVSLLTFAPQTPGSQIAKKIEYDYNNLSEILGLAQSNLLMDKEDYKFFENKFNKE